RMTVRGEGGGVTVIDDYGHHPTEVQVTLRAIRERYPGRRTWLVFQPHQHSRTRFLLSDFARCFGQADHVIVPDIYFVRDSQAERDAICSRDLVERIRANGGDALYLPSLDAIVGDILMEMRPGDRVVTLGGGEGWGVAEGRGAGSGMRWVGGVSEMVREGVPVAPFTWFKLGGPARWFVQPRTEDELSIVMRRCCEEGIAVRFLGRGANLLVDDEGVDATV